MGAKRWFLYLIECRDGSIYTGITVNVVARYATHEMGKGARYTRSHPPRRLLAMIDYANRSSAASAEHAVKNLAPAEKRAYADMLALAADDLRCAHRMPAVIVTTASA